MKYKGKLWMAAAALGLCALLGGCSGSTIDQDTALKTALDHAGVAQEDTTSLSVKEGKEEGREVYEIQFTTQDSQYQYDVAKNNGEIVAYQFDKAGSENASQSSQDSSTSQDDTGDSTSQASSSASGSGSITEEEATAIALEHAGVTQEEATLYRVKADREDGQAVYEVEFAVGTTEYDYTIAQDTGKILSYDSDVEGWDPVAGENQTSSQTAESITLEQATQLVLDRIPGADSTDVWIEYDRDDGRDLYEGEVYYEGAEYEFEIDASTGAFIEWSVDYKD